jgi:prephenate dehydrogenase
MVKEKRAFGIPGVPENTHPLRLLRPGAAPTASLVFSHVAVVGLDALGLSLAMAARLRWPEALVIGVAPADRLEQAVRLHAIDVGAPDPVILAGSELIVLACPPEERLTTFERLCEYVERDVLVTDLCGPKAALMEQARSLEHVSFVGGHPLVDPAGPVSAERFSGVTWYVMPDPRDRRQESAERLGRFIEGVGARPVVLDPGEYDRRLAHNVLGEEAAARPSDLP